MKSIKKILFIMAALAATLAFVSCSSGDDDDDDGVVAVYKYSEHGLSLKITCWDDGTWEFIEDASGATPEMSGTYSGDPSKDGDVKITVKKEYKGGEMVDVNEDYTLIIKNGSFEFDGATFTRQ